MCRHQEQEKRTYTGKETYVVAKRDLLPRQKRPTSMPKETYVHDKRDLRSRRKLASDDRQASVKPLCACEIIYKVKKDLQGKRDLRSRRKLASDDRQASVKCASRSPRCTRLCWSPASSSATSSCAPSSPSGLPLCLGFKLG